MTFTISSLPLSSTSEISIQPDVDASLSLLSSNPNPPRPRHPINISAVLILLLGLEGQLVRFNFVAAFLIVNGEALKTRSLRSSVVLTFNHHHNLPLFTPYLLTFFSTLSTMVQILSLLTTLALLLAPTFVLAFRPSLLSLLPPLSPFLLP